MRKIQHFLEYLLYLAVKRGLRLLPHRMTGLLGQVAGFLFFLVAVPLRRLATDNLRLALPELDAAARRRTVLACFAHWARVAVETISISRFGREDLRGLFDVIDGEILEAALAEGHGVMLVTAHYGAFEMGVQFLGSHLDRPHILTRPPGNPRVARELAEVRRSAGSVAVDRKVGARGFARALERGRVCALAPDQRVQPEDGVLLDFLGVPAWTTILPSYLAGRRGSPIVPFFITPIDGGRYQVAFLPPLRAGGAGQRGSAGREWAAQRAQELNDVLGEQIRQRPELWLWMHTRWRRNTVVRWKSTLEKKRRESAIPAGEAGRAPDALQELVDFEFLERGTSVLVRGSDPESTRQSMLALGDRWLNEGLTVRYATATTVGEELLSVAPDDRIARLRLLDRLELLMLGDLGDALSPASRVAEMLTSLLEWRAGRRSVVSGSSDEVRLDVPFDRRLDLRVTSPPSAD